MSLENIVILNRWPRFPGTHRWDAELVCYENFICHQRYRVSYIVDKAGRTAVLSNPNEIAALYEIEDFTDIEHLSQLLTAIEKQFGPIDRLIAFSEYLLEIAAILRQAFDIPGPRPAEVKLFRDKVAMKSVLAQHGIRTPRFCACHQREEVLSFAEQVGFPLIFKPVDGASSRGVKRIESRAQLAACLQEVDPAGYEIEEFISGDLYHVDGLADPNGQIPFTIVSQYVNTCLDFTQGLPLGSMTLSPSPRREKLRRFATACVQALGLKGSAFHLELFLTADEEPVFLEVGARVPGADVPYTIAKVTGVNLFEQWVRMILNQPLVYPDKQPHGVGAWLTFGRPQPLPQQVIAATSLQHQIETIYRELVPQPGQLLEDCGGYDSLQAGRFLFYGDSERQVNSDIHSAIHQFSICCHPVAIAA